MDDNSQDSSRQDLSRRVSSQLKLPYHELLKRDGPEAAFATIYEQAVDLVAKALHVSTEKTKFESRAMLQRIMNEIAS